MKNSRKLESAIAGNIAVPAAMCLCALSIVFGNVIDFSMVSNQRSALQKLADNAALSAVRELAITAEDTTRIEAVAITYVERAGNDRIISVTPSVSLADNTVDISISAQPKTFFPGPMSSVETVTVSAKAQLTGQGGNVCMIGLSPTAMSAIRVRSLAQITAESCAIYSNSTSSASMTVASTAEVSADMVCVAGGFMGDSSDWQHAPIEDCPPVEDPLSMRYEPEVEQCNYVDTYLTGSTTLSPGVYCGGLVIDGGTATLKPGEYIITGGPLTVTNNGSLNGENVGFYLAGDAAKILFDYDSNISISAPKSGGMAGILLFSSAYEPQLSAVDQRIDTMFENYRTSEQLGRSTDRLGKWSSDQLRTADGLTMPDHTIRSDNARRLVGTIYLPNGKLLIDGRNPIADRSEYTVIIADTFELQNGPNLVLRTDYDLTDIPVPDGVGPVQDPNAVLVE